MVVKPTSRLLGLPPLFVQKVLNATPLDIDPLAAAHFSTQKQDALRQILA